MLKLSLLGSFSAYWNERPFPQRMAQKAQALLIYLAVETGRQHQRDTLMSLFWPDSPQKSAQQSLRQTLYLLRQTIDLEKRDAPLIQAERFTVSLNKTWIWLDVEQFVLLSANGRLSEEWQQAVELYRGHFLADFYLPDSSPFEEWVAGKRAFYQRQMQMLLQRLAEHHLGLQRYEAAETAVRRQLEIDNLNEAAHRHLLKILAKNGRRQEALTHYQMLQQLLQDELAVTPESDTVALVEMIRAGTLPTEREPTPLFAEPTASKSIRRHNLPNMLSSFIGRVKELNEIVDLISEHRLLMLSGAGGIGKTMLSIQVGHQLLASFPDGVWLVELAPVEEAAYLEQTIVRSLGIWESPDQSTLDSLLTYLQTQNCLLILDNCEHLIDAVAHFVQIALQRCPDLKILAGSREILNLAGEVIYTVPPLSLPSDHQSTAVNEWQSYEAIRLFVERATAVQPQFEVTKSNIQSIVHICRQLDGIPLAIELAAARVKLLTTQQIAVRLDNRFRFLTTGQRTAVPRQQTLQALIDWSWELLSKPEQTLLRRLSVFSGDISLSAIESVCTDDIVDVDALLDLLAQLHNKSLLLAKRSQGQEARYSLLETIRHYGINQLLEAGEESLYRQRHLTYYQQTAAQAEQELLGSNQIDWLRRMDMALDNIRTALQWALKNDVEAGLRVASGLWKFWEARGYIREGESWLEQLIAQAEGIDPFVKAKAIGVQSDLNISLNKLSSARQKAELCFTLSQEIGYLEGVAFGQNRLAHIHFFDNKRDLGVELASKSLAIYTELDNQFGIADSLVKLAEFVADQNNVAKQQMYMEKSLRIYKQIGHLAGIGSVYYWFGFSNMMHGNFEEAQVWLEKDLAIKEQLNSRGIFWSIMTFGFINFHLGNYTLAQTQFEQCIPLSRQSGELRGELWAYLHLGHLCLKTAQLDRAINLLFKGLQGFQIGWEPVGGIYAIEGIAGFFVMRERPQTAVKLYAWADAMRASLPDLRPPFEQANVDQMVAKILEMIDKETYQVAYATGQKMTTEEVIDFVSNFSHFAFSYQSQPPIH